MFSNRMQVAQVCRALTNGLGEEPLFGASGPTVVARQLHEQAGSAMTGGDRALLDLAFWLWEGGTSPRVGALIELLDRTRLRSVGALLIALADGGAAVERWLRANGGPVGSA
jgi:hypothetical protein